MSNESSGDKRVSDKKNTARQGKRLSILVPCYNEESNLQAFMDALLPVLKQSQQLANLRFEIIFVDDGSSDATLPMLINLSEKNEAIKIVSLSRNFGKEAALTAALDFASGDAVIPIDADLQDPVGLIPDMLEKWQLGADVVLARRIDRSADSLFQKLTAKLFYKIMGRLSATPVHPDVGDYRLLDRRVVDSIRQLPERTRFMKGLFSWPGFKTEFVDFTRVKRHAGQSKWPFWKLFNYALDGLFSFSTAPLRIWTYIGLLISFFSLLYLLIIVVKTLIFGVDVQGYASIVSIILFFSGINLIGLGILGEYLGRVFMEVKQRPIYLVSLTRGFKEPSGKPPTD